MSEGVQRVGFLFKAVSRLSGISTRALAVTLPATTLSAFPCISTAAANVGESSFSIPAGPLASSILTFGEQSGLQVTADTGLLKGRQGHAVSGMIARERALALLLEGSGLSYRPVAPDMVMLVPVKTPQSLRLSPLHVAAPAPERPESGTGVGSGRTTPGDIIVTASTLDYRVPEVSALKIDAPLRDIPQTVDVVPEQVMRDQRALSLQDVLKNVAGIGLATGDGQRDQATIRGFTAQGDLFVDGLRDDALYFRDLSNVERVEIIKGPASVLFGRGSSGGLINRITRKPGTEGGEIVASIGSWDAKRGEIDLGHVFAGDQAAVRLTGAIERSDSYRDKQFLHREAIAPSFAFTPGERTTVLLQADYLRDRRVTDHGIPAFQGRPVNVDPATYYGAANARDVDFSQSEVWSTTATIDHDLGGGFSLHDGFRYYDFTLDRQNTIPNIVNETARTVTLNRQSTDRTEHGWFNQLELTKAVATGPLEHKLLLGLESGQQIKNERRVNRANVATVDLFDPVLPVLPLAVSGTPSTDVRSTFSTLGLYVQDLIALGEHWKALAGLRYDSFRQKSRSHITNQTLLRTDQEWSPRLGLVWQPSKTQSWYASWNRSFQPSGEAFALSVANADISPEKTVNYEVGARFDFLDGRVSTTVSAFQIERSGIKAVNATTLITEPIGTQRTRGVEASGQASLADGWRAIASYAHLDARITRSTAKDSGVFVQGNRPTLTPRNSASVWVMHDFQDRFGLGGGLSYVGDRWANLGNTVVLPAYVTADASAWVRIAKLKVQLNLNNIFDRDYIVSGHGTSANLNMPGAPRSAMLTLRYAIN